jgi:hypothetical protein
LSLSLRAVRNSFEDGFFGVDDVVGFYRSWLVRIFYVICYRFNFSRVDYQYAFFRGLKRGDNRYGALVCRRFERLSRLGRDLVCFGYGSHGNVRGSVLHVVLEYDSSRFGLCEAWLRVGRDLDFFVKRVRGLFDKKVSIVRVFESHTSGYPHVHILLVFHNYVFSGYSSRYRGRLVYRIFGVDYEKLKGSASVKRSIGDFKGCWLHGFSDFELVDSFGGGVRYLGKYLAKSTSVELAGVKGIRGLAMCWVFHKRSFSISGSLFDEESAEGAIRACHDEIITNGISNLNSGGENSDVRFVKVGIDLYGISIFEKVGRWRLFGFCLRDNVLWDDWRMHFVSRWDLVCVLENVFDSYRSYYDVVVSRVC